MNRLQRLRERYAIGLDLFHKEVLKNSNPKRQARLIQTLEALLEEIGQAEEFNVKIRSYIFFSKLMAACVVLLLVGFPLYSTYVSIDKPPTHNYFLETFDTSKKKGNTTTGQTKVEKKENQQLFRILNQKGKIILEASLPVDAREEYFFETFDLTTKKGNYGRVPTKKK